MFNRWRQENFFKYLGQELALMPVEYAVVPDDPHREVPNPAWARVDPTAPSPGLRDRLQAEYGLAALTNLEKQRRTMRASRSPRASWTADLGGGAADPPVTGAPRQVAPTRSGANRHFGTGHQAAPEFNI